MRSATADAPSPSFQTTSPVEPLLAFQPLIVSDVVTAVRALPDKSCSLDVLPTRLLKAVIDTIAPFITELFNRSLSSGRVPEVFKAAYVTPRIKKADIYVQLILVHTDRSLTCLSHQNYLSG